MSLQMKIRDDLLKSIKAGQGNRRDMIKIILGELQRQQTKQLDDSEVIRVLRKLEKSQMELLENIGTPVEERNNDCFIMVLREYIPEMVSTDVIVAWISENVDFNQLKNRMQAVGMVMKHFGQSADGNQVKDIVLSM